MATLTAWKFPSATGADTAFETLQTLARRDLIEVLDAVVISWAQDSPKPETKPETHRLRPASSPDARKAQSSGWRSAPSTSARSALTSPSAVRRCSR